jgi:hypothetical protein
VTEANWSQVEFVPWRSQKEKALSLPLIVRMMPSLTGGLRAACGNDGMVFGEDAPTPMALGGVGYERGRQLRRPYVGGCNSPVNQPTASDFIGSDGIAICST